MKVRRDQVPYLDQALKRGQARQLRRWLLVDGISYRAASLRLKEQFQIQTSAAQLCRWYQKTCQPRPVAPSRHGRPVLLDFRVYRRGDGWQFLLLQRSPGLRIFVDKRQVKALAKVTRAAK